MMKHGAKVQLNHMSTDERRKLLETSIDKDACQNGMFPLADEVSLLSSLGPK